MNLYKVLEEVGYKLLAVIIYAIFAYAYKMFRIQFEKTHPLLRPALLFVFALIFLGMNVWFGYNSSSSIYLLFFLISSLIFGWLIFSELLFFWRMGFLGGDRFIEKGVDYKKSLAMCKNSLDFLGIGANKLISERDAFRDAIKRCNRDYRPIRFLLCPPDHPDLLDVARQAGRPEKEYQETVRNSLRELYKLKVDDARNIEVRFYAKLPLFRLMFINDSFCLVSHYILAEGSGAQLSQLHIWRHLPFRRDKETLYYPFKKYFEALWGEATPWDYERHL
jgi:hypothetical protein